MADELNRQALPIHDTKPYKNYNFQTSQYFGLSLWKLVHSLNLVCSFQCCVLFMFDQTLAEHQLYRDKGLCAGLSLFTPKPTTSMSKRWAVFTSMRGARFPWNSTMWLSVMRARRATASFIAHIDKTGFNAPSAKAVSQHEKQQLSIEGNQ